ncbi:MAG: hypothetical protein ACR2MP_11365 [Streptosporangiaceae bacterium]
MTPFRLKAVAVLAAVVGLAGLLMGARSQPAAARTTPGAAPSGWRVVYQSTSKTSNQLYSVAAVSPGDAWAAGASAGSGGGENQPLVLHWNGISWKPVAVPGLAGFYLPAVAASSASDVWLFAASAGGGSPKAVRWNGSQWVTIPLPAGSYYPDEAVVLSPTDAWVAGPQQPCTGSGAAEVCSTTLYHWDGSSWSPFTLPLTAGESTELSASSPTNVWVVGASNPCVASRCSYSPVAYHWNGSAWLKAPPLPLVHSYYQPDVAAGAKKNVWVSGWSATRAGQPGRLMHWNGRRWQIIDASSDLLAESPLVTDGARGAWMGPYAHWTGTQWVNTEPFSPVTCGMADLTRIPGTATLWGAGSVLRSAHRSDSVICAYPKAP